MRWCVLLAVMGCGRIGVDETDTCNEPWSNAAPIELGHTPLKQPTVRGDGLELYAADDATGQLWVSTRATTRDAWAPATMIPSPKPTAVVINPSLSDDGLELFYTMYEN